MASFDTLIEDDMSKSAALDAIVKVAPTIESGTVVEFPGSGSPEHRRSMRAGDQPRREYLTAREVDQLCDAARKRGRYGHRDATMILIAYRHGLRVAELVGLQWRQVDL